MLRFVALVKREKPDVLHLQGRSTTALAALAKTLGAFQAPLLMHDQYGMIEVDTTVPWWFRIWGRRAIDQYVGVYDKLGRWAVDAGIPGDRVSVIGNALDLTRISSAQPIDVRRQFGIPGEKLVGVVVCGIRPQKGIDILMHALALAVCRMQTVVLVAGEARDDSYFAYCKALRKELELENTVMFVGGCTDVPALLKGVDYAVMPSISESGPLVLIEYMATGLPFAASQVGDISRRAAESGVPGFVPPGDAAALAKAIDEILSLSRQERVERGQFGRDVALREFDIRVVMPRWYALYDKTIRRER
jgi:glycosyltransferase involved in cell wall biosynthesis